MIINSENHTVLMHEDDYRKIMHFKEERNSLIDDLTWYKAKVERFERENRFLFSRKDNLFDSWRDENKRSVALSKRLEQLERENEEMKEAFQYQLEKRLQYFNKYQQHKALNTEFSQHIGNKPASSTYKYFREKLDDIGIREGE
ncbi:hypothetical protein [Staphylococcus shinii]|uniref:hypothetical protein n=1 Tax=Staphylococcus shinii TaxID=2912228 RepID=UPI003CEF505B